MSGDNQLRAINHAATAVQNKRSSAGAWGKRTCCYLRLVLASTVRMRDRSLWPVFHAPDGTVSRFPDCALWHYKRMAGLVRSSEGSCPAAVAVLEVCDATPKLPPRVRTPDLILLIFSGRFQPCDTSRQLAARAVHLGLKGRLSDLPRSCLESIGVPRLSSPPCSTSETKVSGSPSPGSRTNRIYPAVSSRLSDRVV